MLILVELRVFFSGCRRKMVGILSSMCFIRSEGIAVALTPEFIYPANWVGDQTLLYRATKQQEFQRSLDPPPLDPSKSIDRPRKNVTEPIVAFGPPGSTGELNVSVVASTVPLDFSSVSSFFVFLYYICKKSNFIWKLRIPRRILQQIYVIFHRIDSFGGPGEIGGLVIGAVTGSGRQPDVKGTLIESSLREDSSRGIKYYKLEFRVEHPLFRRHNVAVCCSRRGKLYTLNAQAPELAWPQVKSAFYTIADSFNLTS